MRKKWERSLKWVFMCDVSCVPFFFDLFSVHQQFANDDMPEGLNKACGLARHHSSTAELTLADPVTEAC